MKNKLVSVVIPAKDEEETIGKVLKDLNKTIKGISKYSFETIVVADHCADKTARIARANGAKVITNNAPPGKGNALKAGFRVAKGNFIVMLDSDYSHRPEDLPLFLDMLEHGYGLVVGSRYTGGSDEYTLVRSFGNLFLTLSFVTIFGVKLSDALNGYKAFRKEVISDLSKYKAKDFEIEIELIANCLAKGYRVGEVPSHERERAGGRMKSKAFIHGPKFLFKIITAGLKYRFG